MKRAMSVAGSFYPASSSELERYFNHFTKVYDENFDLPQIQTKAVIVPHAGYVYSGYTANIAFRLLAQSNIKKFVVIGPSHRVAFEGVSLCEYSSYDTPFGEVASEGAFLQKLQEHFKLKCLPDAHAEHSTEVQFPFLNYYIKDLKLLELVYGRANPDEISKIIDFILSQKEWGVVISTDLSHFYKLHEANILDNICMQAIEELDISKLHNGCEACGNLGVEGMLKSAQRNGLTPSLLDYRTSADASGDENRVVGYMSAAFS